jgi:hypothetical protein
VNLILPPTLVRIEGAVMLALSILLYGLEGESWLLFVVLFLVPDLSMLGYLGGPRIGAVSYNLFYTHAPPGMLAAFGLLAGSSLLVSVALVWFSHIGFDRMVGFGLKYPTDFRTPSTNALTLTIVAVKTSLTLRRTVGSPSLESGQT